MKDIAQRLRAILEAVEPRLSHRSEENVGLKPDPCEWSKKEILGHLIDSAVNNHQRFVRAVYGAAAEFPPYDQEAWVRIQRHNERPWPALVALWSAHNHHLSHVIECIPEDAESSPCNIGSKDLVPLRFVVEDYLRHLQHHLKDILGESGTGTESIFVLSSPP